jgi:hypothetical protein
MPPQLSAPVKPPQFLPRRMHIAESDSGAQHVLGIAPDAPSQTCVPLQPPQLAVRELPQLSGAVTLPHVLPRRAQKAASVSA